MHLYHDQYHIYVCIYMYIYAYACICIEFIPLANHKLAKTHWYCSIYLAIVVQLFIFNINIRASHVLLVLFGGDFNILNNSLPSA
jgi:hypothetical protein